MAEPALPTAEAVSRLDALPEAQARQVLERCCGAARWVEGMLAQRPFITASALLELADSVWRSLRTSDYLEAFAHHPQIGENVALLRAKFASTAELSQSEQAGAVHASEATLSALREQNRAYRDRFGFSFIVCATGKSAGEMLRLLEERLNNSRDAELAIAADEQREITRLRLEKLES